MKQFKDGERGWVKEAHVHSVQLLTFPIGHTCRSIYTCRSILFILINVGQKLMSSLDWTEYINFCNCTVCNKKLKVALIQFVQSGVKNAFLSKEFVKITRIFSQIDWRPDNRFCFQYALISMQITRNTLNCHRLRFLTGHSDMAPGYHEAGKNISNSLDDGKAGFRHYQMSHFMINDASHVANNTISLLKNYSHFDASKVDQFSLSDIKTLRSDGEEQTITEITAVLTDRALER